MMNATQASDHVFVLASAALVAHINVVEHGRREYELFSSPTTIFLGILLLSAVIRSLTRGIFCYHLY